MGLRCSLLGHEYGDIVVEHDREERGAEIVVTERELRECQRCGAESVVSENTEVRRRRPEDDTDEGSSPEAGAGEDTAETERADGLIEAAESTEADDGTADDGQGDDAIILDDSTDVGDETAAAEPTADRGAVGASTEAEADASQVTEDTDATDDANPDDDDAVIVDDESDDSGEDVAPSPDADAEDEVAVDDSRDIGDGEDVDGTVEGGEDVDGTAGHSSEGEEAIDGTEGDRPTDHPTDDPADRPTDQRTPPTDPSSGPAGSDAEPSTAAAETSDATAEPTEESSFRFGASGRDAEGGDGSTDSPSGIASAGTVDVTGPSDGSLDGILHCPACGYSVAIARTSNRAGDICPECHAGYLAEEH